MLVTGFGMTRSALPISMARGPNGATPMPLSRAPYPRATTRPAPNPEFARTQRKGAALAKAAPGVSVTGPHVQDRALSADQSGDQAASLAGEGLRL